MAKGQFWDDTFEKLAELGTSTVKKAGKSVKQTFNPLQVLETPTKQTPEQKNKKNHTPLDFEKLQQKYQNQDEKKLEELRHHLFRRVRSEEEQVLQGQKQKKQEQLQKEQQEEEEKKKRKAEEQKTQEQGNIPQGKERKSIFAPKKRVIQDSHQEFKPSGSKN